MAFLDLDERLGERAAYKPSSSTVDDGALIELANAIFEYLEIFHNRQRRDSALRMLTPIEYERAYPNTPRSTQSSKLTQRNPGRLKTRGGSDLADSTGMAIRDD